MYSLEELRNQNQEISDLCDVLSVLIENKKLYSNPVVCELMARFKEKVWVHLVFEDKTIYAGLSSHDDESVSKIAKGFHDSARVIKKQFSQYIKHWCNPEIPDAEYTTLLKETREVFRLIMERVKYENEYMFPLVEKYQTM